jgi:SCP-2 sterol transfer family
LSAESYFKLPKLTEQDGEPVEHILRRAAERLRGLTHKATIQLRLLRVGGTAATSIHSMRLTPAGAFLHAGNVTKPTLVVITTAEAFNQMAEGSYSPVQAYLDGKIKLEGNIDLGRQIFKQLGGSVPRQLGGPTQDPVCPTLTNESWKLDEPGVGSLTVSGLFFTPGGTVDIVYDWGGGFYQQHPTANSEGGFTVTEGGLFCGDIPGHPGVGVILTATDLSTGLYTTQGYPTPC